MYEVEQKFIVKNLAAVREELEKLGIDEYTHRSETDTYFIHPARDFAETDEAIRMRRDGDTNRITYKGPKIDQTTKTRREIDLPLPEGVETFDQWCELLAALSFKPVGEVHKERDKAWLDWEGTDCQAYRVEVSLDTIEELGTFVELEVIVDEDQLDQARAVIASLAERLGLKQNERRSYLCLLTGKEHLKAAA